MRNSVHSNRCIPKFVSIYYVGTHMRCIYSKCFVPFAPSAIPLSSSAWFLCLTFLGPSYFGRSLLCYLLHPSIHESCPLIGPDSQSPHPVSITSPCSLPAPRPKKDVPSKTAKSLSAAAEMLMKNSRGVSKMFAAANTRTRPPGSGGAASVYTDADLESVLADVTVDDLDRQKLRQKRKGALSP